MGWFKRTNLSTQLPSSLRTAVPSKAQAAELRGRARRRLVGAVVLVLAAVIVLPMILDPQQAPMPDNIPIRISEHDAPFTPQRNPQRLAAPTSEPIALDSAPTTVSALPPTTVLATPTQSPVKPKAETKVRSPIDVESLPKPKTQAETRPATRAKLNDSLRSDDGALALALLAGRITVSPPSAAPDKFVLQLAAYATLSTAQARRDSLHQAGINNAFVESGLVNGKPQYRLRVGPFAAREAAQQAQAQLRTLGYNNGFIAAQ